MFVATMLLFTEVIRPLCKNETWLGQKSGLLIAIIGRGTLQLAYFDVYVLQSMWIGFTCLTRCEPAVLICERRKISA